MGALLLYLGLQNYSDYFVRYTRSYQFTEVTGQSVFVRDTNARLAAEGRPLSRLLRRRQLHMFPGTTATIASSTTA